MKLTNRLNLPDAIVRAVKNDPYNKGDSDYSISDLLSLPRQRVLRGIYKDRIEEDVYDKLSVLYGQALHRVIERANLEDVVERRLYWKVLGKTISGAMDNYNPRTGVLSDYKTAKVSKFQFSDFKEWEEQQNCYAQLLRWHKEPISKLQIVAFFLDYRPKEVEEAEQRNRKYPLRIETISLPLWPEERVIAFIEGRIKAHESAKVALPECSAQERWARPETWVVKCSRCNTTIPGKANYAILWFAKKAIEFLGAGHFLEHRKARNIRCEEWCNAAKFCEQFKKLKAAK